MRRNKGEKCFVRNIYTLIIVCNSRLCYIICPLGLLCFSRLCTCAKSVAGIFQVDRTVSYRLGRDCV